MTSLCEDMSKFSRKKLCLMFDVSNQTSSLVFLVVTVMVNSTVKY